MCDFGIFTEPDTLKLRGHLDISQKIQDKIRMEKEKEEAARRAKEEERLQREREAAAVSILITVMYLQISKKKLWF